MTWVAAAIVTSAVLSSRGASKVAEASQASGEAQAASADRAAELQRETAKENIQLQRDLFAQQLGLTAPYRQAGVSGLNRIQEMLPYLTQRAPEYKPFTAQDLKTNLAPNYQFMLQQGLGATRQGLNVGGGGSNIQTGATKFAEDYASNAYQNALQNYMTQQAQGFNQQQTQTGNIYNRLASIAGLGQTGVSQAANAASGAGQNIANISTGAANAIGQLGVGAAGAIGSGNVGAANAMANAYGNIGNSLTLASLMRAPNSYAAPTGYGTPVPTGYEVNIG